MRSGPVGGDVNLDALAGAIAAIDDVLRERRQVLSAEKKAKLTILVYQQLTSGAAKGQIEGGFIKGLIDLAS